MTLIVSAIGQGLIWGLLGIGLFITFRILNFPDMTVEGTFPFGAADDDGDQASRQAEVSECDLADDDCGKTDDDRSDAHVDVRIAVVLRDDAAAKPDQAV